MHISIKKKKVIRKKNDLRETESKENKTLLMNGQHLLLELFFSFFFLFLCWAFPFRKLALKLYSLKIVKIEVFTIFVLFVISLFSLFFVLYAHLASACGVNVLLFYEWKYIYTYMRYVSVCVYACTKLQIHFI